MWSRQQNASASPTVAPNGRNSVPPLTQELHTGAAGSQNPGSDSLSGESGLTQKRAAASPATRPEPATTRTAAESGRGRLEGRSPAQNLDQQTNPHFRSGLTASQNPGMGPGPNIGASFTSSIAQRRLQRRPMGLRLDNVAGGGHLSALPGTNGNGPPPTAHGSWTMDRQNPAPTQPLPEIPSGRWDDSAPSTPKGDSNDGRPVHPPSRPLGIIGGSFNSNGTSACATPSEAPESLTSFQRYTGPLTSSSFGGAVPALAGSFGLASKDSSWASSSYGGSSGSLARRPSMRQPRVYPMSRVSGLNYIDIAELAGKLDGVADANRGLVIDMRRSAEYLTSRIVSAINMTVPTTLVKRRTFVVERLLGMLHLTKEQRQLATNWKSAPWVVLYGEGAPEDTASEDTSLVLLARKFMSEALEGCSVFVLQDGFREFSRKHASLCEFGSDGLEAAVPAATAIPSLSLPAGAAMPMMTAPLLSVSTPLAMPDNSSGLPTLARPTIGHLKPAVEVDHPMLRTMRQTPGGGFDPSEVVAMRLPHDFSSQQRTMSGAAHGSQRLQALPSYLRRAADPTTGPLLLNSLFRRIDDSESRRISSMIGSHGMVTAFNKYTISAGLELGQKNRYNNIYPFDSNRVRLRSMRRSRESSGAESASQLAFGSEFSETTTPSASYDAPELAVAGTSLQARLHGSRPFSIDAIGARPTSLQGMDGGRLHKRGSTKRSSHQVESKSKGKLLMDDVDSMGSDSDFAGGGQEKCDYVNASYVSYFDGPLYIATQGPLPATVNDFWRMVWEEHSRVIVMLTNEFENGRAKCHRYWPALPGESTMYGNLCVEFLAEALHPDDSSVIARRFRLTRPSVSKSSMCITHLQYLGWADHGIPENPLGVLRLQQLARQAQIEGDAQAAAENVARAPMIVHCSAGCGRTGAFCVIDTILSKDGLELGKDESRRPSGVASTSDPEPTVDTDGDVAMSDSDASKEQMQLLPAGSSYDKHGMFTGLVPQALRSKSSNAALSSSRPDAKQPAGSSLASRTPESDQDEEASNRRSLTCWNEEPPAELHEDQVYMVVSRFRELRVTMVQTIKQFVFCHEAVAWVALNAGPRPIDHVIDRRLVAEWNRKNHPEIPETDRTDVTYLMRGRQEMVHAMLSSDISGSNKTSANVAAATISGAGATGRASIDVVSGMPDGSDEDSENGPPIVKRSNTVGPGRRWLVGSLFKSAEADSSSADTHSAPTSRVASRQRELVSSVVAKDQHVKPPPPRMALSLSSGPRLNASAATISSPVPIAEEESSTAMDTADDHHSFTSQSPQFAVASAAARPRLPLPTLPLPPAPLITGGIHEPTGGDYFGMVSTSIASPTSMVSADVSNVETGGINAFASLSSSTASDWRRSMLGHLDAAGDIVARRRRGGGDGPRSPQSYMNNSALASPGAQ